MRCCEPRRDTATSSATPCQGGHADQRCNSWLISLKHQANLPSAAGPSTLPKGRNSYTTRRRLDQALRAVVRGFRRRWVFPPLRIAFHMEILFCPECNPPSGLPCSRWPLANVGERGPRDSTRRTGRLTNPPRSLSAPMHALCFCSPCWPGPTAAMSGSRKGTSPSFGAYPTPFEASRLLASTGGRQARAARPPRGLNELATRKTFRGPPTDVGGSFTGFQIRHPRLARRRDGAMVRLGRQITQAGEKGPRVRSAVPRLACLSADGVEIWESGGNTTLRCHVCPSSKTCSEIGHEARSIRIPNCGIRSPCVLSSKQTVLVPGAFSLSVPVPLLFFSPKAVGPATRVRAKGQVIPRPKTSFQKKLLPWTYGVSRLGAEQTPRPRWEYCVPSSPFVDRA